MEILLLLIIHVTELSNNVVTCQPGLLIARNPLMQYFKTLIPIYNGYIQCPQFRYAVHKSFSY